VQLDPSEAEVVFLDAEEDGEVEVSTNGVKVCIADFKVVLMDVEIDIEVDFCLLEANFEVVALDIEMDIGLVLFPLEVGEDRGLVVLYVKEREIVVEFSSVGDRKIEVDVLVLDRVE